MRDTNKGIEFTNPFKQKKSRFNKQKFKRISKMKKKSKIIIRSLLFYMVRQVGLEPTRSPKHQFLRLAWLPLHH